MAAAVYVSEKSYSFSSNSTGTIAEKILALTMLTHGLSATQTFESGKCYKDWYIESLESLRKVVIERSEKFPDDEWFREQKSDIQEDFGLNKFWLNRKRGIR